MWLLFYTYQVIRYRFYIFLISFLVGVATATIMAIPLATITFVCLVSLGIMVIGTQSINVLSRAALITASIALACFALGLLRFEVASWQFGDSVFKSYVGQEIVFTGEVVREPDAREHTTQLYVSVADELLLVSTDAHSDISYGDMVTVRGEVKEPESFITELGRTFNYPAYLLVRGVEYQVSFAEVTVEDSGYGNVLLSFLFTTKQALMSGIELVLEEPYAGLGEGLLLGVKQAIGEDIESAFRTSGIIHIVVLSGYNVMLVVTFILFLLSFVLKKQARIICGFVAIVLFALLVGLSATVVRASVMASILLLADLLGRRYDLGRALLCAGAVMVCVNPYLLVYDVGFQLSFMATLGLIIVAPTFETFISDGFSKLKVKDFFISTLATQIAVLPLLIYHIGEVSLVAVVVNVLVLPVVPLAMLLTFLVGIVSFISLPLAMLIGFFASLTLQYIVEVALFFATLPLASVIIPETPAWLMGVLYVVMLWVVLSLKMRNTLQNLAHGWTIEEEIEREGETLVLQSVVAKT